MASLGMLRRIIQISNTYIISHQSPVISCGLTLTARPNIYTSHKLNTSCSTRYTSKSESPVAEKEPLESPESPLEKLEKEYSEKVALLSKDVEDFKDKYQRTLADRENLRQRLERQITETKLFGIQSFCKDLLEVTDVFRKAIESVPPEKVKEADHTFETLYDGVVMTENQLLSVLRRHGLQKIIPQAGDKFDPSTQEAMFEVPLTEGQEPGTVAHVVRSGWKLHDRCVRSAQVGVVKL